jgi:very-short-patch-repair endonuclease
MPTLERILSQHGGIVHRSVLRPMGFGPKPIARAVSTGRVRTIGRNWVITRECPVPVARAAALGASLTCVSAAEALGLWAPTHDRLHVSVTRNCNRKFPNTIRTHWGRGPVATPGSAVEPLPNILFHVAQCLSLEYAVAVFDSALNKKLLSAHSLRALGQQVGGRFSEVASWAEARADSGLESLVRIRLTILGIDFEIQVMIDGHPVDILIGERLIIQIDGHLHAEPARHTRDMMQDARLVTLGYEVMRVGSVQIEHAWSDLEAQVLEVVTRGDHLWDRGQRSHRSVRTGT